MHGLHAYERKFGKPTNLYKVALVRQATAVFNARNRQAELNAARAIRNDRRALEIELADLELYYQDMYLHGGSMR